MVHFLGVTDVDRPRRPLWVTFPSHNADKRGRVCARQTTDNALTAPAPQRFWTSLGSWYPGRAGDGAEAVLLAAPVPAAPVDDGSVTARTCRAAEEGWFERSAVAGWQEASSGQVRGLASP